MSRSTAYLAIPLLSALADAALAVQFALVPEVRQTLIANDNVRLVPDEVDGPSAVGVIGDLRFTAVAADELYSFEIKPRAAIQRYEGDSTRNREDYYIDALATRVFERSRASLAVAASDVSTLTSELLDSGRVFSPSSRISWSAAPQWSYSVTDKLSAGLNAYYTDVDFENSDTANFVDYLYYSGGTSLTYAFSDRTSFTGSLSYSVFRTPENRGRSETKTWQFGLSHKLSETTDAVVSFGHAHSDIDFVSRQLVFNPPLGFVLAEIPSESKDGGAIFNVEVRKRLERLNLGVDFIRSLQPSSEGVQSENVIVRGRARWRWRPDLIARADFTFQQRSSLNDLNTRLNQDLYVLKTGLRKTLTKRWDLEGDYQYRRIDRPNGTSADFNRVGVTLTYNGKPPDFPVIR